MNTRHSPEDIAYLREQGFTQTADEIERLHKIEDATARLRDKISTRLNNCLCEMKPGYDDSIVGFNEAWDIVRKTFDEALQSDVDGPSGSRCMNVVDISKLLDARRQGRLLTAWVDHHLEKVAQKCTDTSWNSSVQQKLLAVLLASEGPSSCAGSGDDTPK